MNQFVEAGQESNDSSDKFKELDSGNENPAVTKTVVLDSDAGESNSDGGEGGAAGVAAKMGGTGIGDSCSSWASRTPPPFLSKLYDMLANDETHSTISWSSMGTSFVIWNHHLFAANILPIYFKHSNVQSFVSQLNSYGFKKIRWEQWEFAHEYFQRGERHLLKNIKRRNRCTNRTVIPPADETQASMDTSSCDKEFKILMKEHDSLKMEIIKLKERQETMQKQVAHFKSQALSSGRNYQKIIMLGEKIISWKQGNTHLDEGETAQKIMKRKRNLEEKKILTITQSNSSTMSSELGSYACSNALQGPDTVAAKMPMDEEMGNYDSDTFIPLEDLIGKPFDTNWVNYMQENSIDHLKS